MDQSQKLAILLTMAEEQTAANATLQADLKEQITALARATNVANQAVEAVKLAANDVQPAVKSGAAQAVEAGVGASLKNVGDETKTALENALKPIIGGLAGAARSANDVEAKLNRVTASFGWKWALMAGGIAAGTILAVAVIVWATLAYQRYQLDELAEKKAELTHEVAALQTNVDKLAQRGGRIKLSSCGPKNRLCVQLEPKQGDDADQRDFKGAWYSEDGKRRFVIPVGY